MILRAKSVTQWLKAHRAGLRPWGEHRKYPWGSRWAQWACVRPWVRPQHQKQSRKERKGGKRGIKEGNRGEGRNGEGWNSSQVYHLVFAGSITIIYNMFLHFLSLLTSQRIPENQRTSLRGPKPLDSHPESPTQYTHTHACTQQDFRVFLKNHHSFDFSVLKHLYASTPQEWFWTTLLLPASVRLISNTSQSRV